MRNWRVNLTGDPWHLKTLAGLGVGVSEDAGALVLRHPELDRLTDAGAVRLRAGELVDALNGLGGQADSDFGPVEVGAVTSDDGSGTISIFVVDQVATGDRAGAQVIDPATGQPIPAPPPFAFYARAMTIALRDDAV